MSDNAALATIVVAVLAAAVVLIVTGYGASIVALAVLGAALYVVWRLFA